MKKIFNQIAKNTFLAGLCTFLAVPVIANTTTTETTRSTTSSARNQSGVVADSQATGSRADVETTRLIRQELVGNNDLSAEAKNITVVTLNNTVTLRGSVATEEEKQKIAETVETVASQHQINNEIQVTRR